MRPPECAICHNDFDPNEGGLIYFKRTEKDEKWYNAMKATGGVGHPPNAEWFCPEHFAKIKEYQNKTLAEAFQALKSKM